MNEQSPDHHNQKAGNFCDYKLEGERVKVEGMKGKLQLDILV